MQSSATAPCVALPPPSMESSSALRAPSPASGRGGKPGSHRVGNSSLRCSACGKVMPLIRPPGTFSRKREKGKPGSHRVGNSSLRCSACCKVVPLIHAPGTFSCKREEGPSKCPSTFVPDWVLRPASMQSSATAPCVALPPPSMESSATAPCVALPPASMQSSSVCRQLLPRTGEAFRCRASFSRLREKVPGGRMRGC